MRKSIRVKLESEYWNMLKAKAAINDNSIEDESNIMLKKYVESKN